MATTVADEPLKPAAKVTRAGWYALFLVSSAQAMSLLDRQILSILAPAIREDLGIGDAELGLLYGTVFSLFYALFSLPLGRLVDGWIRTRLLAICIAAWSIFAGLSAFASGFTLLAISRLGVGIGEGASQPGAHPSVHQPAERQREQRVKQRENRAVEQPQLGISDPEIFPDGWRKDRENLPVQQAHHLGRGDESQRVPRALGHLVGGHGCRFCCGGHYLSLSRKPARA